jgi:hypothetical protein
MKIPKEEKIEVYTSGPAKGMPVLSYFFRCGLLLSDARDFVCERIGKLIMQAHPHHHEWTAERQPFVSAAALRESLGGEFFSSAQKFVELIDDLDERGRIDVLRDKSNVVWVKNAWGRTE